MENKNYRDLCLLGDCQVKTKQQKKKVFFKKY